MDELELFRQNWRKEITSEANENGTVTPNPIDMFDDELEKLLMVILFYFLDFF